jgi:hypothetical protein
VKIDGKVEKWPLERVIAEAQKSTASGKRFEEANHTKAKVDKLLTALREDSDEADSLLKEMGIEDPMEFFRTRFGRRLQTKMMTADERKAHEQAQENKRLKGELEKSTKEREEQRLSVLRDATIKSYDQGIGEGLSSVSLPKNAFVIKRMCEVADTYLADGLDPNWKAVAQTVEDEFFGGFAETLESIEDDAKLEKLLREKTRKRMRKMELGRLRGKEGVNKPNPQPVVQPTNGQKDVEKRPYMNRDEMLDYLESVKQKALREGK